MSGKVQKKIRKSLGQINRRMNSAFDQEVRDAQRGQIIRAVFITAVAVVGLCIYAWVRS